MLTREMAEKFIRDIVPMRAFFYDKGGNILDTSYNDGFYYMKKNVEENSKRQKIDVLDQYELPAYQVSETYTYFKIGLNSCPDQYLDRYIRLIQDICCDIKNYNLSKERHILYDKSFVAKNEVLKIFLNNKRRALIKICKLLLELDSLLMCKLFQDKPYMARLLSNYITNSNREFYKKDLKVDTYFSVKFYEDRSYEGIGLYDYEEQELTDQRDFLDKTAKRMANLFYREEEIRPEPDINPIARALDFFLFMVNFTDTSEEEDLLILLTQNYFTSIMDEILDKDLESVRIYMFLRLWRARIFDITSNIIEWLI